MSENTELQLQVQGMTLGVLTTNARGILEAVKVKLEGYKAENYSEENIQEAKKDKAELNAAAKQLNDKRIELEREFMKPFDEFKAVVTETCGLIKTASTEIDYIVREIDEREKQAKRKKIEDWFAVQGCQYFTLDRVFRSEWLNKTTKIKDIQSEITTKIAQVEADLSVLEKIGEPEAKAYYLTTLDLHRAVAEADRIKANRERLAEIERQKNAPVPAPEKASEVVVPSNPFEVEEEPPQEEQQVPVNPFEVEETPTPPPEPILEFTLKFRGTKEVLRGLKEYIERNGIEYEKLS